MPSTFTPSHRGGSGSPLVLIHGFTDTWRSWELALPALEAEHDVLAITLPGHAGGPDLPHPVELDALLSAIEAAMDEAGFETAHIAGNSLGGYAALHLAARGRARSVVALAPAGGWAEGDTSGEETLQLFANMGDLLTAAAEYAEAIASTPEGRRQATQLITVNVDHLEPAYVEHLIRGAAGCVALGPLIGFARREGWSLEGDRITCPVQIVWGEDDAILKWPGAAARFHEWLPEADWLALPGVGHCIQLDVPQETARIINAFAAGVDRS